MITFLSSPKPFKGIAKEHQYRAIRSWQAAAGDAEVILYGDSPGIEEAGRELGVEVVKEIGCAPSGIPYVGAIVEHAAAHARHEWQVYLNGDILLSNLLPALQCVTLPRFLVVGQRMDLGEEVYVDVTQLDWKATLRRLAEEGKATLHSATGVDYFAFRRGTFAKLPPIVIGRAGYDHALLAWCFRHRIPVVDATFSVVALHQFHEYKHVAGGAATVERGEDARRNTTFAGGRHSTPNIADANYAIRRQRLIPCEARGDWLRRTELKLRFQWGLDRLGLLVRIPWRVLRALGWRPQLAPTLEDILNEAAS